MCQRAPARKPAETKTFSYEHRRRCAFWSRGAQRFLLRRHSLLANGDNFFRRTDFSPAARCAIIRGDQKAAVSRHFLRDFFVSSWLGNTNYQQQNFFGQIPPVCRHV
jgi:hypothetical protein